MSVFTFETELTRVSSPWLRPAETPENKVMKLDAEPQEGAIEYKLHLLLRPGRRYRTIDLGTASASDHPPEHGLKSTPDAVTGNFPDTSRLDITSGRRGNPSEAYPASSESRSRRLYHLTTQLLWRLQQSTKYNPLGTTDSLIPKLPDDDVDLAAALKPGNLWQGLEESKGALYEIGVSDDGTLVGLPEDEMNESLLTLQVMAASLGCLVEVTRRQCVGECEWVEQASTEQGENAQEPRTRRNKLHVVEALVRPSPKLENEVADAVDSMNSDPPVDAAVVETKPTTEQLRVTLTGPTDGGKSTLLGTLSTGIFDNGSGRSRTFLLRHRHELASGMTTSVSQMLLGYKNNGHDENLINSFSDRNTDSWEGIHNLSRGGRLVLVSDSAGHVRFRRTILRGLVGWAPHWTIVCLAANDGEAKRCASTCSQDEAESAFVEGDQTKAYLDLCLNLRLPLVIVITKLDIASTTTLRSTLTKVLAAVKGAGRVPKLLIKQRVQSDPTRVPAIDEDDVQPLIAAMNAIRNPLEFVPIVSTSAVKGEGIGLLHALLQNLPIPPTPTARDYIGLALNPEQPDAVFHIEDKFSLSALHGNAVNDDEEAEHGTVVAGYIRFGHLTVGDQVLVGPFPPDEDSRTSTHEDRGSPGGEGPSLSQRSSSEINHLAMRNSSVPASTIKGEWCRAHIATIRNLRLPVRVLEPDQAGTIGIVFDTPIEVQPDSNFERPPRPLPKIWKGMVMTKPSKHMIETSLSLQAASRITAVFEDASTEMLMVGSTVKVYIASVRASARILCVSSMWTHSDVIIDGTAEEAYDDVFSISDEKDRRNCKQLVYKVSLELLSQRQWVEMGSQLVILEGGSRDTTGLESFVGRVVEIEE